MRLVTICFWSIDMIVV